MTDRTNNRIFYAYARADGEDLGEWMFGTSDTLGQAQELAQMHAETEFADGEDAPPEMVLFEMVPKLVGTPQMIEGEIHGPGDSDPDEFDGWIWDPRPAELSQTIDAPVVGPGTVVPAPSVEGGE